MKKNLFFLAVILLVPFTLYILSLETVVPIPPDENHGGLTKELQCFDCHGKNKEFPRKKEHPPKDLCFQCHKIEEE